MWSRTWRAWSRSLATRSSSSRAESDSRYAWPANFASTTTVFEPGSLHDEVGAETAVFRRHVRLRLEVAVLEHPRHLDDSPELDLSPAAAHVRPVAEGAHEVPGLGAELALTSRRAGAPGRSAPSTRACARPRAAAASRRPSGGTPRSVSRGARPPACAARAPASSAAAAVRAATWRGRGRTGCSSRARRRRAPSASSRGSCAPPRARPSGSRTGRAARARRQPSR